jgi:NAD(P)-dependent dehydrogenase (short-subunit alcohol dehydrogenase family)
MARQTIVVWGASGGVGTSTVATMLAHQHPGRVTLIDLAGDLNRILALPDARHGVSDLSSPGVPNATETLHLTSVDISPRVSLVPFGDRHCPTTRSIILADGPLADLAEWIRAHPHVVIVDAGVGPPPEALREVATDSLAVTRLTRVNAERLQRMRYELTGLIVVEQPDASLSRTDVATLAATPIYATLPYSKDIPHAIDAGMFLHRLDDLARLTALPELEEQVYINWFDEAHVTNVADYWLDAYGIAGFDTYEGDIIVVGSEIWTMSVLERPWSTFEMRIHVEPNLAKPRDQEIAHLVGHPRPPDRGSDPLEEWMLRISDRLATDVDFGHAWQSSLSEDRWRLSWNTGSGELHTVNQDTAVVTVLGTFANEQDVHAALDGWARHHDDENGLDWIDAVVRLVLAERRAGQALGQHHPGEVGAP